MTTLIINNPLKFPVTLLSNPIAPTIAAFCFGFSKEYYDGCKGGTFSGKDLVVTTASAIFVNTALRLFFKKNRLNNKEIIDF